MSGVRRSGWRRSSCEPLEIREPDLDERPHRVLQPGLPRDRRGRIAQKDHRLGLGSPRTPYARKRDRWRWGMDADDGSEVQYGAGGDAYAYGPYDGESSFWDDGEADTPRVGVAFADPVRERDKELLESLR